MNPAASMARPVPKPNEPLPWPMSKMTPRSRAARVSSRTAPSARAGLFGKERKQCVSTSPGRSRSMTSRRLGGGKSRCAMTGNPNSSATSMAMSSGAMPLDPPAPRPTLTLIPTTRSACSRATRTHSRASSRRMSWHSPTITASLKANIPGKETLRNGSTRGLAGSITWRRKPARLAGPAVPASTSVVVAPCRAISSGSTPMDVPPQ